MSTKRYGCGGGLNGRDEHPYFLNVAFRSATGIRGSVCEFARTSASTFAANVIVVASVS